MDQNGDISGPQAQAGAEPGAAETEPPPELESALELDIVRDAGDWAAFEPVETCIQLAARAAALHSRILAVLPAPRVSVCIALSSDEAVRDLNRTWRAKDSPTNVLSFPAPPVPAGRLAVADDPHRGPTFLGDIVLAAETISREAREMGISAQQHLQHLVVHGLLHLLGFDHEQDAEAAAMEALETAILATIGIADPYAAPD